VVDAGFTPAARLDVVYFGNDWAAENRTSSHHVARHLAPLVNLMYVDSPGLRPPAATGRDAGRLWRKLKQTFRGARFVEPGLWHCTVPKLPFKWPGIEAFNRRFGAWAVKRAMRRAGMHNPVLWFVVPHPHHMLDGVPHRAAVYYCTDDFAAHPGVDAQAIAQCDEDLTRRCNHVFVVPPALLAPKQALNTSVSFAPHGVDVELFAQAQLPGTAVPPVAAAIATKGPVVGYFGLLAAWTDLELIEWLARQRPQWQFLLVGQARCDVSLLRACPNVHLVGPQPYETLPHWAKAFDVAIIPYRDNQQVRNANPLKLREYLATGKPVVSVPAPEVERFAGLLEVATSREAYLAAIEHAMATQNPSRSAARQAAVADMSWQARTRASLAVVQQLCAAAAPITGPKA
jgi:glycosyltransferase involved in cell wall biosynthesis